MKNSIITFFADVCSEVRKIRLSRDMVFGDAGICSVRAAVIFFMQSFAEIFHKGELIEPSEDVAEEHGGRVMAVAAFVGISISD